MDTLLRAVLQKLIRVGNLRVTGADGSTFTCGDGTSAAIGVRFTSRAWQLAVVIDPELRLGEAYMNGALVVEQGSIAELLDIVVRNVAQAKPPAWRRALTNLRSPRMTSTSSAF